MKNIASKVEKTPLNRGAKRSFRIKLRRCDLCEELVADIVGLKIPDPGKVDEHPASFSYVCMECYERFLNLRNEITKEAERKREELENEMSPEEEKYEKMKQLIANERMTPKRRQQVMEYLSELVESE